jgi:hypothetical protein
METELKGVARDVEIEKEDNKPVSSFLRQDAQYPVSAIERRVK